MDYDNPVHNRYVSTFDLEHHYLPSLEGLVLVVGEEEKVSTIEGWLHAATKDVTEMGRGGEGGGMRGRRVRLREGGWWKGGREGGGREGGGKEGGGREGGGREGGGREGGGREGGGREGGSSSQAGKLKEGKLMSTTSSPSLNPFQFSIYITKAARIIKPFMTFLTLFLKIKRPDLLVPSKDSEDWALVEHSNGHTNTAACSASPLGRGRGGGGLT